MNLKKQTKKQTTSSKDSLKDMGKTALRNNETSQMFLHKYFRNSLLSVYVFSHTENSFDLKEKINPTKTESIFIPPQPWLELRNQIQRQLEIYMLNA